MVIRKNKKLDIVRFMPPKYHSLPNEKYNAKNSEVIKWLILNPSILDFIWDHIKQSGIVTYDKNTGKWQGIDYEED